jgi:hypothetical protein
MFKNKEIYNDNVEISTRKANEPTDILWENIGIPSRKVFIRKMISGVTIIV